MRLIRLLLFAALAAYLYRRFVADSDAGLVETQAAEPYSSEQLDDEPGAAAEAASGEEPESAPAKDTLERPTWLDPADAESAGSAPAAGDGG